MPAAWYKEIPDDQKITYTVTPRPGALMKAALIGGQLRALARLMTAFADTSKVQMDAFVGDISMGDNGEIRFDLVILPKLEDTEND